MIQLENYAHVSSTSGYHLFLCWFSSVDCGVSYIFLPMNITLSQVSGVRGPVWPNRIHNGSICSHYWSLSVLYQLLRTSSARTVSVSAAEVKASSCCSTCCVWSENPNGRQWLFMTINTRTAAAPAKWLHPLPCSIAQTVNCPIITTAVHCIIKQHITVLQQYFKCSKYSNSTTHLIQTVLYGTTISSVSIQVKVPFHQKGNVLVQAARNYCRPSAHPVLLLYRVCTSASIVFLSFIYRTMSAWDL